MAKIKGRWQKHEVDAAHLTLFSYCGRTLSVRIWEEFILAHGLREVVLSCREGQEEFVAVGVCG